MSWSCPAECQILIKHPLAIHGTSWISAEEACSCTGQQLSWCVPSKPPEEGSTVQAAFSVSAAPALPFIGPDWLPMASSVIKFSRLRGLEQQIPPLGCKWLLLAIIGTHGTHRPGSGVPMHSGLAIK